VTDDLAARLGATRVICLGHTAFDQIFQMEALFTGGSQKLRSTHYHTVGGGMAATASVAVAKLGGRATFWGRAGADPAGEAMRSELAEAGVDVAGLKLFEGGHSSISAILVDPAGERQIANFRGLLPEEADWLPLAEVAGVSAVLADPRWPAGAVALFRAARAAGVPTVLDGDVADAEIFEALLPLTDHAVLSEPGFARFIGGAIPDGLAKIARYGCRVVAVTCGAEGVTWLENGVLEHRPAYTVDVVDTTGAGDVFHGAYALAIGAGLAPTQAFPFAAAAAALKCTRPGGRSGIPTLADCLAFQRNNP
jgi:sulfofructose kinase